MYAIVFHTHQKLDKVAYRHLRQLLPAGLGFPSLAQILHFEGHNGPDATKLKKTAKAKQPWHFIDPFDEADTELHEQIDHHYRDLVKALRAADSTRAGFEAAWLAHALVDGLTPAHHFPYEDELERLRGESRETRNGIVGRAYVKADTVRESVSRSAQLVGPKGLLTTHIMFEAGAYSIIAAMRLRQALPTATDLEHLASHGVVGLFKQLSTEIAELNIYGRFYVYGWTHALHRDMRRELAPRMVRMVTLAWYSAAREAGLIEDLALSL